jgi:NADH:ubiquinone oxidoreductase subunit F (NADH-binding)
MGGRVSLLLEFARRRATSASAASALDDMLAGASDEAIARERGLPLATVAGIRSFYDQLDDVPRACAGTACRFAGSNHWKETLARRGPSGEVRCLGHCFDPPSLRIGDAVFSGADAGSVEAWLASPPGTPPPSASETRIPRASLAEPAIVLRNILDGSRPRDPAAEYRLPDGERILLAVERSGLRGRGGAAFPTAVKWKTARDSPAARRYVVANGDEGDPGSFVDRLLLEEDPHAVLAGLLACARAISATHGIVFVRAEYPKALAVMRRAVAEARGNGWLGDGFEIEVTSGAGSYVCGEETAMLHSIEGLRGEPRIRPPFPAQSGLFGMPTVVQNVETLAVVPWIARHGSDGAAPGARAVPPAGAGTKVVSLAGAIRRPGAVEVALGTPVREILERGGGGAPDGRAIRMVLVGGPMGRVLPERSFETPLDYDSLPGMGHAGLVAFDETVSPRALAEHLFQFARAESCGSCTPCRVGTAQLAQVASRSALERLLDTLETGSLCGFGQGVPRPVRDLLEHFGDAVLP